MNTSTVGRRLALKSLLAGLTCLGFAGLSRADRYVATNGTGNGTSWENATNSIQGAIDGCPLTETVWVSNGVYQAMGANVVGGVTNMIYINKEINLRSTNGPAVTILDGNGFTQRVIYVNNANTVVDGFTITNGLVTAGGGGGAYLDKCRMMTNCVIVGNRAAGAINGGGIYIAAELVGIYNCSVLNNTGGSYGGGMYVNPRAAVISNCMFFGNSTTGNAKYGGGLFVNTYAHVVDCIFSNNMATNGGSANGSYGGGAAGSESVFTGKFTRCVFVANQARNGGGLMLEGFSKADNCDFIANTALNIGGGIYALNTNTMILNSRIVSNVALVGAGGGVNGNCMMSNCVVKANISVASGGAGISLSSTTPGGLIQYCYISDNKATNSVGKGGGIAITGSAIIRNCLIYNNVAAEGGGIFATYSTLFPGIYSCTIASNYADGGGGMRIQEYDAGSPLCAVVNTLVYSNQPSEFSLNPAGLTNGFTNCCSSTLLPPATGNITNNPQFAGFANGNFRLSKGSLCINTGTNQSWMAGACDLEGRLRIDHFSGRVDMGAYEFVPTGVIVAGY